MNHAVIGVIGHVDHGKTALVNALTGQDTDRLAEERQRGMSIVLGFAHFEPEPGTSIDLIDMPGHERFVRTMVSGATGIDAVLMVVAANEGIKPQTVEHAEIAALLGLRRAVIAVTKSDLVDADTAALAGAEAAELLRDLGFEQTSVATVSAMTGEGLDVLTSNLCSTCEDRPSTISERGIFLPIDRAFTMTGHGPVVTGTLRGGPLSEGSMLDLVPLSKRVRVRGLQVHGGKVAEARAGQRVAVNLRGVGIGDLARGMALAEPETLAPADWILVDVRAAMSAPALRNGMRLRALIGTDERDVRLRLLDRDELQPGEAAPAQLRFADPVQVPVGEHVILRRPSPSLTVAGGPILEAWTRRLRRNDAAVLERFALLRRGNPREICAAEVTRAGRDGTTIRHLARLTGLSEAGVLRELRQMPLTVQKGGFVLPREEAERRKRPALKPSAAFLAAEADLGAALEERLQLAGLTPPLPKDIITDAATHRAVERLLKSGVLVRAVDRAKGKELLFHADAIAETRRKLTSCLQSGEGLLVTEITAILGISRKFAMPLLDHLDTIRFTRRLGDRRVLFVAGQGEG